MTMPTGDLLERITADATPVRPLAGPWRRTAHWLAISIPYLALIVIANLGGWIGAGWDVRTVIEESAALATGVTAGAAAFASTVPGADRRWLALPLVPFGLWLATLGEGCLGDWMRSGPSALQLRADWNCLPPALLISLVPGSAMVLMLRKGAPLTPRLSLLFGALAVAALTNVGMRLFHLGDLTVMVLVWHFGAALLVVFAGALLGRNILRWRHLRPNRA